MKHGFILLFFKFDLITLSVYRFTVTTVTTVTILLYFFLCPLLLLCSTSSTFLSSLSFSPLDPLYSIFCSSFSPLILLHLLLCILLLHPLLPPLCLPIFILLLFFNLASSSSSSHSWLNSLKDKSHPPPLVVRLYALLCTHFKAVL